MADNSTDDMIIAIGVDLATIRRGLKKLEQEVGTSTGRVQKQFETVGRGIDNAMTTAMQNRINAMVGVGTKGAKEWTGALADQGKELERLRAKYSPLFATINNYKSAVADIRRAHAVGAISADEMTAAISRERQAALASTAAIKGRNAALAQGAGRTGQGFQTANIAAQFQDIAVTSAMGMSPLQIALQQGTQLSSVLGTMGNGRQVVSGLAAAFASLVSPVSLVTIGLVAGGAAAIQYFSTMEWGGAKSEETLKKEAELVAAVASKWGEALPALKAYNDEREKVASGKEIKEAAGIAADEQWTELRAALSDVNTEIADIVSRLSQMGQDTDKITSLQKAFRDLVSGIEDGTATSETAKRVQTELASVIKDNATPELQKYLDVFEKLAPSIDKAATSASKFKTEAAVLADLIKQLGPLGQLSPILSGDGKFLIDQNDIQDYRARQAQNENPTITNGDGRTVSVPTPGSKPVQLGEEPNKKTETAAQKAANAYRDLIKSADDRIGQLRLETELTGQYGVATDAARFRLELLQQSEDKGRSLSPTQRAEIEQKVALYEKYSQALAETKLQQDLMNQARFSSLSKQDQQIVTTLRQYGLSEDLSGKNAQAIRQSLQGQEIADGFKSFAMQFSTGLISEGKSLGEAFGDAVKNAAASAMQKSLESLFSQIGNALASALMPKLGGGASPFTATTTLGDLLGAGAAPVGAVTRSALPALPTGNMAAYMQAIKDIESGGGNYGALGPITRNGDRGHGAYQVMGNNIGPWSKEALGRSISADEFLKNPALQDQIFAHKFGGYVNKFGASGAAQAWFGGPGSVGKGGMGQDILGTSGNSYVKMFETNVAKMGSVAGEATKGLGGLNGGLQAIAQNFGAAGGGLNLAGLFSSSFKPNTTLGNFLQGIPGFDGGGNTGMGARSGGLDGKGGFLALMHPRETVTDHTKVNAPRAPRLNPSVGPRIVRNETSLTVQIQGASGDDHVRMLVRQGVGEALSNQNEQMRRGGFGNMQATYTTDKG